MTSSQTQALRRIVRGLVLFDLLLNVKRNFGVNWNLDYGTLLKIIVEISHNVNRAQTVFYKLQTIGDSRHKSFLMGNAAMCHDANKIQTT